MALATITCWVVGGVVVSPFTVVLLGCLPLFQCPCNGVNQIIKGGLVRYVSNVIKMEFAQEKSLK